MVSQINNKNAFYKYSCLKWNSNGYKNKQHASLNITLRKWILCFSEALDPNAENGTV